MAAAAGVAAGVAVGEEMTPGVNPTARYTIADKKSTDPDFSISLHRR